MAAGGGSLISNRDRFELGFQEEKEGKRRRVCGDYIGEVSWAGGKRSERNRKFCGVRSVWERTVFKPGHRPELDNDRSMMLGRSGAGLLLATFLGRAGLAASCWPLRCVAAAWPWLASLLAGRPVQNSSFFFFFFTKLKNQTFVEKKKIRKILFGNLIQNTKLWH